MKKLFTFLFALLMLSAYGQSTDVRAMLDREQTRNEIFSAIMSDHQLMMEFMKQAREHEHARLMMEGQHQQMEHGGKMGMQQDYYMSRMVDGDFDDVIDRVTAALRAEGMGVLCDIDVQQRINAATGGNLSRYRILGACHPHSAYNALMADDKVGTLLPCSVIIRELDDQQVEVAVVDPVESMGMVHNASVRKIAAEVKDKLSKVIQSL